MSCPPEATLLLYVDTELEGAELRGLESHLVGCRECRATVVALRDESRLFSDVLLERERRVHVPARARAPEPGVAIGLPATVAAVTAVLAVIGFLLESRVPGGLDLLNPLRLKGAYEMAFDLIFMLRDRVPGAIEMALSIGVVVGISAVLTFAVGALYRHVYGATVALLLSAALFTPDASQALVVRFDEETQVMASEVIQETMLLSGDLVHVDGVIEGDLIVGAKRVNIGGTVKGSVYAFARDLEITGTIEGNLHGLVERTRIDGTVKGSVYEVGESITLGPDGVVERDLSLLAEDAILGGRVERDVVFGGDKLELRSEVGRNVDIRWADKVSLRDGARIEGRIDAMLESEDDLERAPGAQVSGGLNVRPREDVRRYLSWYLDPKIWAFHGLAVVASFLFGLLLRFLLPALFEVELRTSPQFWRSLGFGFLVVVVTPLAILALALTVVAIPVAVLTLFAYITLFYSAELVAARWIGRMVMPPADDSFFAFGRSFFVGLLILAVVSHIPFVGPPIAIVATLIGAGLVFEYGRGLVDLRV